MNYKDQDKAPLNMSEKYEGYVKWFDRLTGQGFIAVRKSPSGKDCTGNIFFHYSSLEGSCRHSIVHVKSFAPVRFDIVDGFFGDTAHRIEYIRDKSRIEVVEDVLIGILNDENITNGPFGKDWILNNWLMHLKRVAKDEGYFINDIMEPFWSNK